MGNPAWRMEYSRGRASVHQRMDFSPGRASLHQRMDSTSRVCISTSPNGLPTVRRFGDTFWRFWRHFLEILETLFRDFGDTFSRFWRHFFEILETLFSRFWARTCVWKMAPKVHSVTLWLHTRLEPVPHFSRSWRHFFGILETLFRDFGDTFFGFWRHLLGILEITLGIFRRCCTPCHAVHWLMY